MTESRYIASAHRTIALERDAIAALHDKVAGAFDLACERILQCQGRVVVTGMGKSGHIANKIAATLASTGTPAFAMHPGEASHGDLGMLTAADIVLALSGSGSTREIITLLPLIRRIGCPLIALTGNPSSELAREADIALDASVAQEACPLGLAPTASTTAALVLGDALAVALLEARGFSAEDFAFSHPGGTLGKKLLLKVADVMQRGDRMPLVDTRTPLGDALVEVTHKGLGMTVVVDTDGKLAGVFTDGDLRRALDRRQDLYDIEIAQLMTVPCKTITPDALAAQALKIMEDNAITTIVVVDAQQKPSGVVHLHALIQAGLA